MPFDRYRVSITCFSQILFIHVGHMYNHIFYSATSQKKNTPSMALCLNIIFVDSQPPVLSSCPSNITVTVGLGNATAQASWSEPTATDNSLPPNVTSTHDSGDYFPIGSTVVTYTATDAFQLTATCSFTVTVIGKSDRCNFTIVMIMNISRDNDSDEASHDDFEFSKEHHENFDECLDIDNVFINDD